MTINPLRWFRRKRVVQFVERDGMIMFPGVLSPDGFQSAINRYKAARTYDVACFQCGERWAEFTMSRIDWAQHRCHD